MKHWKFSVKGRITDLKYSNGKHEKIKSLQVSFKVWNIIVHSKEFWIWLDTSTQHSFLTLEVIIYWSHLSIETGIFCVLKSFREFKHKLSESCALWIQYILFNINISVWNSELELKTSPCVLWPSKAVFNMKNLW